PRGAPYLPGGRAAAAVAVCDRATRPRGSLPQGASHGGSRAPSACSARGDGARGGRAVAHHRAASGAASGKPAGGDLPAEGSGDVARGGGARHVLERGVGEAEGASGLRKAEGTMVMTDREIDQLLARAATSTPGPDRKAAVPPPQPVRPGAS